MHPLPKRSLVQNPNGRGAFVAGHAELAGDGFGVEFVVKLAYSGQREIGEGVSVNAENQTLFVDQRKVRVHRRRVAWRKK